MKPSDSQLELIDKFITQLNWWKSSNDINSPTLSSDIEETINSLIIDDKITEPQARSLSGALHQLLTTIKQIKNE